MLSEPITRVVYQRGEFDAAQTDLVSEALFYFAFSLPFAGVNLILIRTFFSLQRPWTPTMIALANLGVNAGLDALLYKPMGIGGIPLSTAIVSLVTTVALAAVLRALIGGLDARRTLDVGAPDRDRGRAAGGRGARRAGGCSTASLSDSFWAQLLVIAGRRQRPGVAAYAAAVVRRSGVDEAREVCGARPGAVRAPARLS